MYPQNSLQDMDESVGLPVGATAPEFTAPVVFPDGSVEDRSLGSFLAEGPVLLSFYTNDFTPDCIEEWCNFRDFDWFAAGDDVTVVGVSKSRVSTHKRFIDHLNLGFPLISDRDLAVTEAFDVKYRALKLFQRSRRSCFLIDEDREIRYTWIGTAALDPTLDTPDMSELHEAIQAEFGEELTAGAD